MSGDVRAVDRTEELKAGHKALKAVDAMKPGLGALQ
jgi:hypothetical protein